MSNEIPTVLSQNDSERDASSKLLRDIQSELKQYDQLKHNETYLSTAFDVLYSKEDRLSNELREEQRKLMQALDGKHDLHDIMSDKSKWEKEIVESAASRDTKESIDKWGGLFLKTAPLFVGGPFGLAATIIFNGLDQARPVDSFSTQALDFTLGAAQGGLTRGVLSLATTSLTPFIAGSVLPSAAVRGLATGISSRVLAVGLNRQSYWDNDNHAYSVTTGLSKTFHQALHPTSLLADAAVGTLSFGALAGANLLTNNLINDSPFISTIASGATYGFTGGALGEAARQVDAGQPLNITHTLAVGLENATITALAATPGAFQAQAILNSQREANTVKALTQSKKNEAVAPKFIEKEELRFKLADKPIDLEKPIVISKAEGYIRVRTDTNGEMLVSGEAKVNGDTVPPASETPVTLDDVVTPSQDLLEYGYNHHSEVKHIPNWSGPGHRLNGAFVKAGQTVSVYGKPVQSDIEQVDGSIKMHNDAAADMSVNDKHVSVGQDVILKDGDRIAYTTDSGEHVSGPADIKLVKQRYEAVPDPNVTVTTRSDEPRVVISTSGKEAQDIGSGVFVGVDQKGPFVERPADAGHGFFTPGRVKVNGKDVYADKPIYFARHSSDPSISPGVLGSVKSGFSTAAGMLRWNPGAALAATAESAHAN